MRFKNYLNKISKKRNIYSMEDLEKMTLSDALDREDELGYQHDMIGVPDVEELQQSPNVEQYTNELGNPAWRAKEFGNVQNIIQAANNQQELQNNNDNSDYTLDGYVQKTNLDKKSFLDKYKGLTPFEAIQKYASKIPNPWMMDKRYYQYATKTADGEEPTIYMKENNDIYKLRDIDDEERRQIYMNKVAQMRAMDKNNPLTYEEIKNMDMDVVVAKEGSELNRAVKNSRQMQEWLANNYEKLQKGEVPVKNTIKFPKYGIWGDDRSLFTTIHNADLNNAKINTDGSVSVNVDDGYNFEEWKYKNKINDFDDLTNNIAVKINNLALGQQQKGQLKDYLLSTPVTYTREEVEELLKKLKKK